MGRWRWVWREVHHLSPRTGDRWQKSSKGFLDTSPQSKHEQQKWVPVTSDFLPFIPLCELWFHSYVQFSIYHIIFYISTVYSQEGCLTHFHLLADGSGRRLDPGGSVGKLVCYLGSFSLQSSCDFVATELEGRKGSDFLGHRSERFELLSDLWRRRLRRNVRSKLINLPP